MSVPELLTDHNIIPLIVMLVKRFLEKIFLFIYNQWNRRQIICSII